MQNPKAYKLRLGLLGSDLEEEDPRALPHLLTERPRKLEIQYKEIEPRPQNITKDYFGLWSQKLFFTEIDKDGQPQDIVAKHLYEYEWDETTGLPSKQTELVYLAYYDGTFDPEPYIFPRLFITDTDKSQVLESRRKVVFSRLVGTAIASGLGAYSVPFFKKFAGEVQNYKNSGDSELIEKMQVATEGWLNISVPDTEGIVLGMPQEMKDFLNITQEQVQLTIGQSLIWNLHMALKIPTNEEIERSLS